MTENSNQNLSLACWLTIS